MQVARNPLVEGAPREIHIATHRQGATQGHAAGKGKSYTLLHSQTFSGHASHLYRLYSIFWDLLRGAQAEICHTIDVGGIGANHSANSTHLSAKKSADKCTRVHGAHTVLVQMFTVCSGHCRQSKSCRSTMGCREQSHEPETETQSSSYQCNC